MSSCGGPTSSTTASPRHASGPTTTRRRVADLNDGADRSSNYSDFSDPESFNDDQHDDTDEYDDVSHHHHAVCTCGSLLLHHHHHHHHHHNHHHHCFLVIRYLLLRWRAFFCLPDTWLLKIEDGFLWTALMVQSLRSGRNMGRKIFGFLMVLAVLSVFVKVSFLSSQRDVKKIDNGLLIIQTFKDDWAMAQRALTETQSSMPKRVLERLSVSFFFSFFFF